MSSLNKSNIIPEKSIKKLASDIQHGLGLVRGHVNTAGLIDANNKNSKSSFIFLHQRLKQRIYNVLTTIGVIRQSPPNFVNYMWMVLCVIALSTVVFGVTLKVFQPKSITKFIDEQFEALQHWALLKQSQIDIEIKKENIIQQIEEAEIHEDMYQQAKNILLQGMKSVGSTVNTISQGNILTLNISVLSSILKFLETISTGVSFQVLLMLWAIYYLDSHITKIFVSKNKQLLILSFITYAIIKKYIETNNLVQTSYMNLLQLIIGILGSFVGVLQKFSQETKLSKDQQDLINLQLKVFQNVSTLINNKNILLIMKQNPVFYINEKLAMVQSIYLLQNLIQKQSVYILNVFSEANGFENFVKFININIQFVNDIIKIGRHFTSLYSGNLFLDYDNKTKLEFVKIELFNLYFIQKNFDENHSDDDDSKHDDSKSDDDDDDKKLSDEPADNETFQILLLKLKHLEQNNKVILTLKNINILNTENYDDAVIKQNIQQIINENQVQYKQETNFLHSEQQIDSAIQCYIILQNIYEIVNQKSNEQNKLELNDQERQDIQHQNKQLKKIIENF